MTNDEDEYEYLYTTIDYTHPEPEHRVSGFVTVNHQITDYTIVEGEAIDVGGGSVGSDAVSHHGRAHHLHGDSR